MEGSLTKNAKNYTFDDLATGQYNTQLRLEVFSNWLKSILLYNRPYSSFPTSIEKTLRTNSYTLYICTVIITEIGILKFLSVTARKNGQNEILIPPKVLKCDFT